MNAIKAETYLHRKVGLRRLKLVCCQWEAPPAQFRDNSGRELILTMESGETIVTSRRRWSGIRVFEVTVSADTEEI